MVRLVFRPYTQVRRAICTSAPLRASTRVSSGFALLRHSSPSFGSQRNCSRSDLLSTIICRLKLRVLILAFTAPLGLITLRLATALDSLVRVSRRVVSHLQIHRPHTKWSPQSLIIQNRLSKIHSRQNTNVNTPKRLNTLALE